MEKRTTNGPEVRQRGPGGRKCASGRERQKNFYYEEGLPFWGTRLRDQLWGAN